MTSKRILIPHLCSWDPKLSYLSNDRRLSVFDNVYTPSEAIQLQKRFEEEKGVGEGKIIDPKFGKILTPLVTNGINFYKDEGWIFDNISKIWNWSWNFKKEDDKFKGDNLMNSSLFLFFGDGYSFNFPKHNLEFQSQVGRIIIFENDVEVEIKSNNDKPSLLLFSQIEYLNN